MSLYTIGDLHLSLGAQTSKPMDIFKGWDNYVERIRENWENTVKPTDTVVIVGDISWAKTMNEAYADFDFINRLPGEKIILRGNHDYWFSTKKKSDDFFAENGFSTISLLYNNAFIYDNFLICGTRGWVNDQIEAKLEDKKVIDREAGRLKLSLEAGKALSDSNEIIAFLHYPPVYYLSKSESVLALLHKYNVKRCYYGHIHGTGFQYAIDGICDGIDYRLVSCDYAEFKPVFVL